MLFNCRVIPNRGSWLDFEFDVKDFLYFRIDRKKKLPITTFLYAMGMSRKSILEQFYTYDSYQFDTTTKIWSTEFKPEKYKRPIKLLFDLIDKKNIIIIRANRVIAVKTEESPGSMGKSAR